MIYTPRALDDLQEIKAYVANRLENIYRLCGGQAS